MKNIFCTKIGMVSFVLKVPRVEIVTHHVLDKYFYEFKINFFVQCSSSSLDAALCEVTTQRKKCEIWLDCVGALYPSVRVIKILQQQCIWTALILLNCCTTIPVRTKQGNKKQKDSRDSLLVRSCKNKDDDYVFDNVKLKKITRQHRRKWVKKRNE